MNRGEGSQQSSDKVGSEVYLMVWEDCSGSDRQGPRASGGDHERVGPALPRQPEVPTLL